MSKETAAFLLEILMGQAVPIADPNRVERMRIVDKAIKELEAVIEAEETPQGN